MALLQTFANQASVAIQRAGLIDALQDKITQLKAAQVELAKKDPRPQFFDDGLTAATSLRGMA